MFNFSYITKKNIIPIGQKFVRYRILIVEGSGSGQNAFPNLVIINRY